MQRTAFWQPAVPVAGRYDLYAHIPDCTVAVTTTHAACSSIQHSDGATEVAIDQAVQTGWVHLGQYPFRADARGFVYLTDVAGDAGRAVWFGTMRWVRGQQEDAE